MGRLKIPFSILAPFLGLLACSPQGFKRHFTPWTLRVDLLHKGTAVREAYGLDSFKREGPWPGRRKGLSRDLGYGKYRVRIIDEANRALLYTYGFSSLFGEWQTTEEARQGKEKTFHETIRLPCPRHAVTLSISVRDNRGRWRQTFKTSIKPGSPGIACLASRDRDWDRGQVKPKVRTLLYNGPPAEKVDLLIIGDGYTAGEMSKYRRDVRRFVRHFFSSSPFKERKGDFNVRSLEVRSLESGPDEPLKGIFRKTALGATFNTFGMARYLTVGDNKALRNLAGHAPYDTLAVLVNTSRYGGAGIFNFYTVFPSDNKFDRYVFLHEFGHSFGGLGDEYYSSKVTYSDFYPRGVEPWEPNITALLNPAKVKWGKLVRKGTPCPTPPSDERYRHRVGCFEGAGYSAKGLYRPARDCKMFSKKFIPFCPVCRQALNRRIDFIIGK